MEHMRKRSSLKGLDWDGGDTVSVLGPTYVEENDGKKDASCKGAPSSSDGCDKGLTSQHGRKWLQEWLLRLQAQNGTHVMDAISAISGIAGLIIGSGCLKTLLSVDQRQQTLQWRLSVLYDRLIPASALFAVLVAVILVIRATAKIAGKKFIPGARRFGRKSTLLAGSSLLFAISCLYRAMNVADEGAATCRGPPTVFNAPAAGRFVATIGEVALVIQIAIYIEETARRIGATRGLWANFMHRYTSIPFTTLVPVVVAESMSWTGVISGNSKFYCVEYVLWMVIALTWAWDGAELFIKSNRFSDKVVHSSLTMAGLALFFFNALLEIPHFFDFERNSTASTLPHVGIWECMQDQDSPLWLKRLPFFFCYFTGCSWCSVALTSKFLRRRYLQLKNKNFTQ